MSQVNRSLIVVLFFTGLCLSPAQGSHLETNLSIQSKLLGRPIPYSVYSPEKVRDNANWPVLYLLHGVDGTERDWFSAGELKATLDDLIASGKLPPVLVITPAFGNSWYVDDARPAGQGLGPVAQAFLTEFVPEIDRRYPTAHCRAKRAIGGYSMGGYGALLYAFDRPDLFQAAIGLSSSIFHESAGEKFMAAQEFPKGFRGVFGDPFDMANFRKWNLFPKAAALADKPYKPYIYLAAGDRDFPLLLKGSVDLHLDLIQAKVPTELHVEKGAHNWDYWGKAIRPALEWLAPQLRAPCS